MSFTTLRVTARGVVLFEDHTDRLGPEVRPAFERFAKTATEGVYSLTSAGEVLHIERRPGTRLVDDVDVRYVVSPVLGHLGPIAKPSPPSAYDSVRISNTVTLLTDAAGEELYEACIASVMAWDGESLVLVPSNRPRVQSVTEAFIARDFPHRRAPIRVDGDWGLLLINAVGAVTPTWLPGRQAFSAELLGQLRGAIEATAVR